MPLEFDADDQELELFLAETNDHLQSLDQNIVQLETTPDDHQLLQSIFRSAHTIKGGAGLIGHQRMAGLAHAMENVLDGLRSHTLQVTPATIDALLAALDGLRTLIEEVSTREPSPIVLDSTVAALDACLAGDAAVVPPTAPATAPDQSEAAPGLAAWNMGIEDLDPAVTEQLNDSTGWALYDVSVTIDPDCGLSAARTLQAHFEIARTTRLLRSRPTPEEIEADEQSNQLSALIVTDDLPSLLEHRLSQMVDVLEVCVAPVALPIRESKTDPTPAADALRTPGPPAAQPEPTAPAKLSPSPISLAAPRAAAAEAPRTPTDKPVHQESSIRISVGILDDLMSLVSELVLGRTRLQTLRNQLHARYPEDDSVASLEDAVGHLDRVSNDLQTTVMKARMLPVENVFNKFPRLMRDLASQKGKRVNFTMTGQETELDRSVIEQLSDPLIHLLRNAIDHGMEAPHERLAAGKADTGTISLSAAPRENHILIEVRDDGGGIDGAKIKAAAVTKGLLSPEAAERLSDREGVDLVFSAGLSTASTITNISGRGVGMDIVKSTIERMGGHIQIDSVVGQGTTFSITLPLTLAIMQALLVSVDDAVYALPLNVVTEILSIPASQIQMLQGTAATLVRGAILPIIQLRQYFSCAPLQAQEVIQVVATRVDGQFLGLVVDRFIGEQEIVMKPLGAYMGTLPGLAGATILGDGRIGLLVDVAALKNWSAPAEVAAA